MIKVISVFALLLVLCCFSLTTGSYNIALTDILKTICLSQPDEMINTVVFEIRLPRMLGAVISGMVLSVCGVVLQSVFRNLLVSPDLLGVSSGASLGNAIAIFFGFSSVIMSFFSFLGGLIAVGFSVLIAHCVPSFGSRSILLVLSGIVVSAFCSGIVEIICLMNLGSKDLPPIMSFLFGTLDRVTMNDIVLICAVAIPLVFLLYRMHFSFDVISTGEEESKSLGLSFSVVGGIGIVISTVLCSVIISKFGLIGWIGLVVPHIARMWFGCFRHRYLIPASLLLGACFLVGSDLISHILFNGVVPIGIVTSLFGAPFFVYIMYRRGKEAAKLD